MSGTFKVQYPGVEEGGWQLKKHSAKFAVEQMLFEQLISCRLGVKLKTQILNTDLIALSGGKTV